MRKFIFFLLFAYSASAFAECLFICRWVFDPDLLIMIQECELRCPLPPDQNPDNNPEPVPDPVACGASAFISNFGLEMFYSSCMGSCGSVSNPTQGRWGNSFTYSGRVSGTVGNDPRSIISYNTRPFSVDHQTVYGHSFNRTMTTWTSSTGGTYSWEVLAEVWCDENWNEADRKFGNVDLKSNSYDYERQVFTPLTKESSDRIVRLNTCSGGTHTTTQSYQRNHTYDVSGSIKGIIQAKYGWGESYTLSQGTRINIPTDNKYDVMLDTWVTVYNINRVQFNWRGNPDPGVYSGRVRIIDLGLSLAAWSACN